MRKRYSKHHKRKRINKRFIPNILTVFNMFLGFLAIGLLIKGDPVRAGWLILFAGVFDAVDGKLARLMGISSRFGTEFDSFADTISFCATPALLVYTVYVKGLPPLLGGMISFVPLLFGTIRLAKFNLAQDEGPQSYFTGLTTPLNALFIFGYMLFNHQLYGDMGDPRIALVIVVALGFMMISPIRFQKFPILSFKKGKANSLRLLGVIGTLIALIFWRGLVLFPLMLLYISWSILNWMIHPHPLEDSIYYSPAQDKKIS